MLCLRDDKVLAGQHDAQQRESDGGPHSASAASDSQEEVDDFDSDEQQDGEDSEDEDLEEEELDDDDEEEGVAETSVSGSAEAQSLRPEARTGRGAAADLDRPDLIVRPDGSGGVASSSGQQPLPGADGELVLDEADLDLMDSLNLAGVAVELCTAAAKLVLLLQHDVYPMLTCSAQCGQCLIMHPPVRCHVKGTSICLQVQGSLGYNAVQTTSSRRSRSGGKAAMGC